MPERTQTAILNAGKNEFLSKGYSGASMRNIAAAAGVTTGAVYGYYSDKNALFAALVEPASEKFTERFKEALYSFSVLPAKRQIGEMGTYSGDALKELLNHIYENFDEFYLIICCSEGSNYENYVRKFVEAEIEATLEFMEVMKQNGHEITSLSMNMIQILSASFFSEIFETVVRRMDKEEADIYVDQLLLFHAAGWKTLFKMD
ncbi:hypothetical protein MmiHf6_17770 [Methanimicrococcus hongohii]|uniref:HTH tetR-type domain-containing protein n=1 Tax=Methanimicrococcus hongohii TaxID=3028295 RepID=A0AA96ZTD1_9EURY|nr:TetR/AcrR family transcriptional regulator [Methanimicrococcus sp. Hf6]WNY24440.1 hypothetical protein MmiHf6_17770 [Methanimicrococcus sp. Hf6]